MATTNLITKSLGDVLTETGNGTPDHTSPKGSTYVDQNSGIKYINVNGGSSWQSINNVIYGKNTLTGNTSVITSVVQGTWYPLETTFASGTISWSAETSNGITYSASTAQFIIDNAGQYGVGMNATFNRIGVTEARYEMSVAVNSVIVTNRDVAMCSVYAGEEIATASLYNTFNLSGGTTVEMAVSNNTGTENIDVSEANITIMRIGDYLT
jgi:hypothetical protein